MFKKSLTSLALAGLLLTGVSVSQASADASYVAEANLASAGTSFTTSSPDSTSVAIPSGVSSFKSAGGWEFDEAFLLAHAGEKLTYSVSVLDPSGKAASISMNLGSSAGGYSKGVNGTIYNGSSGTWVNIDYMNDSLTIPTGAAGYQGSFNPYIYMNAQNSTTGGTLAAGTYTVTFKLFAAGVEVTQGVTASTLINDYFVAGNTALIPAGATTTQFSATACVDSSKVAVGDEVKAEMYVDDVLQTNHSRTWETRSQFKSSTEPGYREYGTTETITITAYDINNGVAVLMNRSRTGLTVGTEYDAQYKLYKTSTNEDVSGDCAPQKPAAPTATFNIVGLSISGTFSFGSGRDGSVCNIYDKSAPNTVFATGFVNSQMGSSQFSCSVSTSLTSGRTYFVRVSTSYSGKYSQLSDPSADVLIPSAGYTITSSYAGVVAAGKVVKVNDNSLLVEDFSNFPSSIPDGKGGIYTYASQFSCTPICGTTKVRIRHMTNTTLDSTFAGTGSFVLSSFGPMNALASTMGYYGTNKDKWILPIAGYEANGTDPKVQFIFGNAANATTTTQDVNKSALDAACNAGAAGYSLKPAVTPLVSTVPAPSANPFIQITCFKQYTLGGTPSWVSLGVLATVDPATGNLSVKGTLGTPSATANGFVSKTSVNHSATGNEVMITAFVSSHLYTSFNDMSLTGTGTVADHSIIRFAANGTLLSTTTNAWGTSGGSSATDSFPSMASVNSGKIYGVLQSGQTTNLVSAGSTGALSSIAIDTTGSSILMPSVRMLGGYGIASDETLIPVTVSGSNVFAAGWVNSSTGALTVGEKLNYTNSPGSGSQAVWLNGNDKNVYLLISASTAPSNLTVFKWIDSRYTVPTGPVPAVTSKNLKYSKNTPAAGTKVTLTGTNLNAVTSATIGGNAAALGTKSATSLQLTVPTASSAGTVDIVLTTADGATTVDTFTYVGNGVQQSVEVADLAASVNFGAADIALSATVTFSPNDAGTQGAVTWNSDTPTVCSIVSNKVRFLAGGTCTVKATAAASGLLLAGSDTETLTVLPRAQTITLSGPTNPEVDLDGIDLTATTTSGLAITFATTTAGVCSVDSTGHVTPITAGECVVTATQAGNASWLSDSKQVTVVFVAPATTPIVDNGNPASPNTLAKTGAWVKNGDTQLSWNRTKGTLAFKVSIVYIGPIKGTAVFKVGSKTYTCVVNFGTLKKQATAKRLVLTSPNLCSGAKEKAQLAALKKVPANTVVKITIVRDMKAPTTYAKYRTKTRVIYAKLG